MNQIIYADNAATTPLSKSALEAMMPYFTDSYGNPSAVYNHGQAAKRAVETARLKIADAIGAKRSEIFFTSGGTESDNWAIFGTCDMLSKKGRHLITASTEHSAVLKPFERLEKRGFDVTYLQPDAHGHISPKTLEAALRPDTILVSIMTANNVIGTLQDIKALREAAKGVLFHTDAVQAIGHIPVDVRATGVDMLSLSAHKFNGPKGIGALFIKGARALPSYMLGGGQEKGRRSGTENVPAIAGMAVALQDKVAVMNETSARMIRLRDELIAGVLGLPGTRLTGDPVNRLPGLASFVFEGVRSEYLVEEFNSVGVCVSAGSACSSGSVEAPHVVSALGIEESFVHGALRISLGEQNTIEEVRRILGLFPAILAAARVKSRKII